MKCARLFVWLLIVAMLTVTCPALGDELTVEVNDDTGLELEDGIAVDFGDDAIDPEPGDGDLSMELPDLALADDLTDLISNAPEGDPAANGSDAGGLNGVYYPRGTYDNDALFAGYVDMLFGKTDTLGLQSNGWVGDRLTGASAKAYDYLLGQIKKVAAGKRSSTEFVIPSSVLSESEAVDAYYEFATIVDALLVDCPYHLFWYDKTGATPYGVDENGVFYASFPVAQEFASSTYTANANKIKSAGTAAAKAKNVVKKYAGTSDYDKLCGYRDYICKANTYNDDAAADESMPYGNPWQLIWVFDGDSSTNVVCEGYSKAFQYLCDLSSFKTGVQSHIVSGYGGDGNGSGPHMWNVVTMGDGKNYHTDITFVDSGLAEAFLAGAASTGQEGVYCVANTAYYQFDEETKNTYPAATLKLSTKNYDPSKAVEPKSVKLKKGTQTLKKGQKLSLKRGKSLTLKAVVSPSKARTKLTWTSSYKYVTVKDGKVTVSKKAKVGTRARITVKTANEKSTYIYIVVK